MSGPGIDWGNGLANVDRETGIRFGVISQNSIADWAIDDFDTEYPETEHEDSCTNPDSCDCGSDYEPIGHSYERGGYVLSMGTDGFGIFVLKSPFTTRASFCSPCAPGAGDLDSPRDDGIETYCLGPEWFENEIAPYPITLISPKES